MRRLAFVGAAAFVACALATPAMAQEVISNPGYCAQFYPNANCQNKGPGNPYTGSYQRERAAYGAMRGPYYHHRYTRFRHPVLGHRYTRFRHPD